MILDSVGIQKILPHRQQVRWFPRMVGDRFGDRYGHEMFTGGHKDRPRVI